MPVEKSMSAASVTYLFGGASGIELFAMSDRGGQTDTWLGARWETATTGTWLQRDTPDTLLDLSNANRYAFAGCDPINGSDASGMACAAGYQTAAKVLGVIGAVTAVTSLVAGGIFVAPETGGASVLGAVAGISGAVGVATGAPSLLLTLIC